MPTLDQEIDEFEKKIRTLKIEYDIFFVGGKKTPPVNLRNSVEATIQRLLEEKNFSFAQKFRFNTLVARYNAYRELWRKRTVEKEERGELRDERELQSLVERVTTRPAAAEEKDSFSFVTDDPSAHRDQARALFDFLSRTHERVSGQPFKTDFEKFFDILQVKTSELTAKFRCSQVEFEAAVDRETNKVKFSAKAKK